MCTAITLSAQSGNFFLARTMDFSYDLVPQLIIMPRSHTWDGALEGVTLTNTYRFMGLGQEMDGLLAFFDGINEEGFAAAALFFAGYARYEHSPVRSPSGTIASVDFLHYLLGQCGAVSELPSLLKNVKISGVKDPMTGTVSPLHWIAADKSGACVVIESTKRGVELLHNSIGVMTNSPDLHWHMTNLRNYIGVTPTQTEKAVWGDVPLIPFGQGGGTIGLPGGFSSPERFVRAAYLKTHIPPTVDSRTAVGDCFHVLANVALPKGAVITSRGTYDYTRYTAVMNLNSLEYFYRTYDDFHVKTATLW